MAGSQIDQTPVITARSVLIGLDSELSRPASQIALECGFGFHEARNLTDAGELTVPLCRRTPATLLGKDVFNEAP